VLHKIPFQDSLSLFTKDIKKLPNYLINNLVWVYGKALKHLPQTFANYISPELMETAVKKAEYYLEQDLCYEVFILLESISLLNNHDLNDFLISKLNLLDIVSNYIKKNYDFEITAKCLCLLQNLSEIKENEAKIFAFFQSEIFLIALDAILIDINDNYDLYCVNHLKQFFSALLNLLENFLLELDGKQAFISKTLTENAIEINTLYIISRLDSASLVEKYLRYIKKKLRAKNELISSGFISIGFLQFLLEKVFEEYKADLDVMLLSLDILEVFLDFERKFKNKFVKNAFICGNAYTIVEQLCRSYNDKIAEKANSIIDCLV